MTRETLTPRLPVIDRLLLSDKRVLCRDRGWERRLKAMTGDPKHAEKRVYAFVGQDGLQVLLSLDDTPHGTLWHLSLAYPNKTPDYADLKAVKDAFFPHADLAQVFPRQENHYNLHPYCLHLYQLPFEWQVTGPI